MSPDPRSCGTDGSVAAATARPRVLVLAESLPWPSVKGGDLRTWQNVNALAQAAEVGVFGLCSNDTRRHRAPDLPLAFWTASTDPALTSPPPKDVRLAARAWLLEPRGHPSDLFYSSAAAEELARLLADFRPDAVLVEGVWLHGYLACIRAAGCRTIVDCFNVESALYRELARTGGRTGLEARVVRDVLPERTEAIERSAVAAADQLWVCSDEDERRLRDTYAPRAPVVVIPNGIALEGDRGLRDGRASSASPDAGLTLLFTGFFPYLPNAIAAEFLIDQVFPRLAAVSGSACRLQLVGAMPTPAMRAAAERDARILVTGAVEETGPYLAGATAMAVPLFHGGGTRLKILEAFAGGLPVVSTAKGAEGLGTRHGRQLLIAETADEFVDGILSIWRDPARARRLAERARALVVERFSWAVVGPRIRHAFRRLHDASVSA